MTHPMLERIAFVTKPPKKPIYSDSGYIIQPDGTTYSLTQRWCHGLVLALLYPEVLASYRDKQDLYDETDLGTVLTIPDHLDDVDVYAFQRFELANHSSLPALRVCPGRMVGPVSVDKQTGVAATEEQIRAMKLIVAVLGLKYNSPVCTDFKDTTITQMWSWLKEGKENGG